MRILAMLAGIAVSTDVQPTPAVLLGLASISRSKRSVSVAASNPVPTLPRYTSSPSTHSAIAIAPSPPAAGDAV